MKYSFLSTVIFWMLVTSSLYAQQPLRANHIVDPNIGGAIVAREFQPKPEKVESVYLNEAWERGTIVFSSGDTLGDLPMKIDLKNNLIEIRHGEEIKILPITKCKALTLDGAVQSRLFINGNSMPDKGFTGLVEPLVMGKLSLYNKPNLEVYRANYNAAMDVGNRNDRYVVKEQLFMFREGNVIDVSKAGKKIMDNFQDRADEVKAYAKTNALSFKKKEDLIKIIAFYNSRS